jgi:hypothetical protein
MKTRPKDRGTAFETELVREFSEMGLYSRRLPEGGANDLGDLEVVGMNGMGITVEAKAREVLNVTRELHKAREKSGQPVFTALAWKRLVKKQGKKVRQPDGERVVVVIGLDTFKLLVSMAGRAS